MHERVTATMLGAAVVLGACSTPLREPSAPVPLDAQFVQAPVAASAVSATPPADPSEARSIAAFWREFQDPPLDALVAQALAANTDVKLAQARLQEARAQAGWVQAETWPTLETQAGIARTNPPGPDPAEDKFSIGATFNWEIDLVGRSRAARASAAASVSASEAGVSAAQRLISAEVASNYLGLRTLQHRLAVAQRALLNQREALRIVSVRETLGRGSLLDVSRARALVDGTEASLPALQAAIDRASYRLATLTGQTPRAVNALVAGNRPLPHLPLTDLSTLPVDTPQRLLERRPDLIAAWRQVQAARANITLARADLFPRISLTGALGFSAPQIAEWGEANSRSTNAGAFLIWTPFDFGRIRSRIGISEARAEQAWLSYGQTIQLAIEETEGALAQYTASVQQVGRLDSATRHAAEAARLARLRFDAGASDFLSVLDAERSLLQSQDALVQAQGGTLTALVAVYRALGGGWTP